MSGRRFDEGKGEGEDEGEGVRGNRIGEERREREREERDLREGREEHKPAGCGEAWVVKGGKKTSNAETTLDDGLI